MLHRWFRSLTARPMSSVRRRTAFRPGLEALEERALMTAGALDLSFNGSGKENFSFNLNGTHFDLGRAVAVDSLGRIIVAGSATNANGNADFAVARLLANGELDRTFSGDGLQTITFDFGGNNQDVANAVAIDAQGRIVLAGNVARDTQDIDSVIVRLKSSGEEDGSST